MRLVQRFCAATALLGASAAALAHDGHGIGAAHWHATDTAGFVVVALLAGLALWLANGE